MTPDQLKVLRFLADHSPCFANEIGRHMAGVSASPRSVSARGAGLVWELIHAGYVERTLRGRELYVYSITPLGQQALRGS